MKDLAAGPDLAVIAVPSDGVLNVIDDCAARGVRALVVITAGCNAKEMVRSIRGYPLWEGYRGHPPADIPAIEALLLRLSRLVEEVPEISEIDLNPVFALPPGEGCLVIDARIRINDSGAIGESVIN